MPKEQLHDLDEQKDLATKGATFSLFLLEHSIIILGLWKDIMDKAVDQKWEAMKYAIFAEIYLRKRNIICVIVVEKVIFTFAV